MSRQRLDRRNTSDNIIYNTEQKCSENKTGHLHNYINWIFNTKCILLNKQQIVNYFYVIHFKVALK